MGSPSGDDHNSGQRLDIFFHFDADFYKRVDQLITFLTARPAVAFKVNVNLKGEKKMASGLKATIDLQINDLQQVEVTASLVDAKGNPPNPPGLPAGASAPTCTPSDATVFSVAGDSSDSTGLSFVGTPLKLGTGITFTVDSLEADGVTHITGVSTPVDVTGSAATGFVVTPSAK